MARPKSDSRHRRLSARDREWIAALAFAFLFVVAGAIIVGWTIPRAITGRPDPVAALIFLAWVGVAGVSCLLIGGGARRGDEIGDRALAERRRSEPDWKWPR